LNHEGHEEHEEFKAALERRFGSLLFSVFSEVKEVELEVAMNSMIETKHLTPITLTDGERQRCEVWTRVMGYHRPVASFNIGKKGEHCERRFFREERARPNL